MTVPAVVVLVEGRSTGGDREVMWSLSLSHKIYQNNLSMNAFLHSDPMKIVFGQDWIPPRTTLNELITLPRPSSRLAGEMNLTSRYKQI